MAQGKKSEVPTTQTGIRIPNENIEKLKYIAKVTYVTFTDVVNDSLNDTIGKFEKKNGVITEEQIKKVLKK
jgi:predicted DNA-binding protein